MSAETIIFNLAPIALFLVAIVFFNYLKTGRLM